MEQLEPVFNSFGSGARNFVSHSHHDLKKHHAATNSRGTGAHPVLCIPKRMADDDARLAGT